MEIELPMGRIALTSITVFLILGLIFLFGLFTMQESLKLIMPKYGYLGVFIASFLGSTIFVPFAIEFFLPPLKLISMDPMLIVIAASFGSMAGTWVNYALGFIGSEIIERRVDHGRIEHAKHLMNRYGWFGLFIILIIPFPLPVDPVTIVPGITRMNFLEFSIVILTGKLIKYSMYLEVFSFIIGLLHVS